jgi:hypothetical protein
MKTFLFTIMLTTLAGGLALAANGYGQSYGYSACANNNSKACNDARAAFASHHNGQTPDQYNRDWYQGQQGRWNQRGNNWQWNQAQGDQWYQGRQGHWYQENDGMRWRGDRGDEYGRGANGWQWSGARHKHGRDE